MCTFLPREPSRMSWRRSTSTSRLPETRRTPNLWTNRNSKCVLILLEVHNNEGHGYTTVTAELMMIEPESDFKDNGPNSETHSHMFGL